MPSRADQIIIVTTTDLPLCIGPDGNPVQLTYPHTFSGIWTAENRAGCIDVLHGLATGRLDADVLPFPFYSTSFGPGENARDVGA